MIVVAPTDPTEEAEQFEQFVVTPVHVAYDVYRSSRRETKLPR